MRISRDLAKRFGAKVVVLHVVPKGIGARAVEREQAAVDAFVREHAGMRRAHGLIREAASVRQAIIEEASQPRPGRDGRIGPADECQPGWPLPVRDAGRVGGEQGQADGHRGEDEAGRWASPPSRSCVPARAPSPTPMPTWSAADRCPVVVDKWFAENTFHAHEFADIRKLVALKERHNLTISVGLPGAQRGEDDRDGHQAREGRARWTACRSSTRWS